MDETSPSAAAQVLDLLRRAYVERRSGELHLDRGDEHRGLSVREGHVVHGLSDVPGERLGDVLVRHGDVSQADLERAEATARSEGRLLGAVLVETGLVEKAQFDEAVACHVREILFSALDEPGVSPTFEPTGGRPDDSTGWTPASRLSTGELLLDAARRLEDPALVREALGDPDRKLVLATDPWLRAQPVALTPTDGFVLSRVDGTLSARELVGLIPLPAEETEKSLLGLLCTGAVAFVPDRPAAHGTGSIRRAAAAGPAAAGAPVAPPAAPSPPAGAGPPKPVPPRSSAPSPEEVRRLILEAHDALGQRDHFEILGVTAAVDDAGLRAAYARLARMLHPDACRDPVLADVSDQREAVFVRVREAYEALRDPKARAEYEADLRRRKARATPAPSTPLARAPGSTVDSATSTEQLEQIVAAGEELLRSGQYGEAIQQVEPFLERLEGDLRVRARMTLARASMKYPEWRRRAEAHLQDVLREDAAQLQDPVRLEACLLLGDLYKASELPVRAAAMYRKALTVQPGNRHALRELSALEGTPAGPGGTGSLLGFLKKR